MKRGEHIMKILKIKKNRAFFLRPSEWLESVPEEDQPYRPITEIDEGCLIEIIDFLLSNELGMDEYQEGLILNPAEEIVYKQIYEGLKQAAASKEKIKADVDAAFDAALQKYD